MKPSNVFAWVAWVLVVIGALNWGLVGVAEFNFVSFVFGTDWLAKIIYIVVGLGGFYMIYEAFFTKK